MKFFWIVLSIAFTQMAYAGIARHSSESSTNVALPLPHTSGLSRVQNHNRTDLMVLYATGHNEMAFEGSKGGFFTRALVNQMTQKDVPLAAMMDLVRQEVQLQTDGVQSPYYEGSGLGSFTFAPSDATTLSGASLPKPYKKIALVIGNAQYDSDTDSLAGPAHDARAVTVALQSLGYDTKTLFNANLKQMQDGLSDLRSRVSQGDHVVVYYSGHGSNIDHVNALTPVDMDMRPISADFLLAQAVRVTDMVDQLKQTGAKNGIIILDAQFTKTPIRDKDCKCGHLRSQLDSLDKTVPSDAHTSRYQRY